MFTTNMFLCEIWIVNQLRHSKNYQAFTNALCKKLETEILDFTIYPKEIK